MVAHPPRPIAHEIRDYHAHVYFTPETRENALAFQALIASALGPTLRYLGRLIDRPIGPHPIAMFELNFLPEHFATVVPFLMQNHGVHSVLIHPETGDDPLDHSTHALWLGRPLELDFRAFAD